MNNLIPNQACFKQISGRNTIKLIVHHPASMFVTKKAGGAVDAAKEWGDGDGNSIYIDDLGMVCTKSGHRLCIMDFVFICPTTRVRAKFADVHQARTALRLLDANNIDKGAVPERFQDVLSDWCAELYKCVKDRER